VWVRIRMHLQGRRGTLQDFDVNQHWIDTERRAQKIPKFAKFANFLNFSGASQKLIARKLIILIILAPRKK
jgi:hypothetical protein